MKKVLFTVLAGIVFAMPMNAQFLRGLAEKAIEKKNARENNSETGSRTC